MLPTTQPPTRRSGSTSDTLFAADSAKVQEELAKRGGYEVVATMAYRSRTTSLDAEVTRLKAANPDVFLPTSYTTDATLYVKTAKTLDYIPKLLIAQNAGGVDPAFVQEMRADIEGPGGRDISEAPTRALTAFTVLVDAINRARSTNPEDIRKALVAANVPAEQLLMPWTAGRFDEKGQNTGVRAILQQIQKGAYATIYPFDLASADVVYPRPGYKEKK